MLIRYIVKQLSGYVSCQKWLSPCQDARASTHFLYVPDHFSKWPQRLFSLKEQLATPLWQRLVTLVQALNLKTGRRGGKEQTPLPRFKNWKQHSSLYQLLTYDSIDAISSLTSSKAAPTKASVPGLPFYCFMSQHPIACQERDTTQNGQVLQSLEHVELSPVDIHESQHCCEKKQPTVQTILQRQTISYSQNNCYVVLPGLSTWFLTHLWISKMTDLKTIHYCQGKKTSGSSYCRKMTGSMQPILLWHNYGAITDIEGF